MVRPYLRRSGPEGKVVFVETHDSQSVEAPGRTPGKKNHDLTGLGAKQKVKMQVIQGGGKPREIPQNDLEWAEYLSYEAEQEKDDRNRRLLKYLADHILGTDLEGIFCSGKLLCEVKTINISDEEANIRASYKPIVQNTKDQLEKPFFTKLKIMYHKG